MRCKYRPYVRRANGREKAQTLRIAMRLAYYQARGKRFYVMVQRGFPNVAIAVGPSKRAVQRCPLTVNIGAETFRGWSRAIGSMPSQFRIF
jgi:hypothetical protein